MGGNILSSAIAERQVKDIQRYPWKPITETITNGFFIVDPKWIVKYWNKAAEKILNVKSDDIVGKNLWEKFVGLIPLDFYDVYHLAFLKNIPFHFEEYWGEMGAWFDVSTYHCDGNLSVSFKSSRHSRNYSHPDKQDQQLKLLTEFYRLVTEVTNDCLWEWDLQNKEVFWIDGGHKRVFGYKIENALIPQSFWESCIHPEDKPRIMTKLNKIISRGSGYVWEDEYRFLKANGDYAYVHDRGHIIYDEGKTATRMIGATQDITERKVAEWKVMELSLTRQKEITQAVMMAQEIERANIGRELHENLNQILGAAKLYIEIAKSDEKNKDIYLEKSSGFLMKVIEEIRKISKTLILPDIHFMGLSSCIRTYLDDLIESNPVKITFIEENVIEDELNEKLQLNIYKIVQEQTSNILKHAKANHAKINLSRQPTEINLVISDDGKGCDMSKVKDGAGLMTIKSRTELYHGTVTIVSIPGKGYELKVILPITTISDHNN